MFESIKKLFTDYRKHIKFYAILFLVVVIVYIAVSPSTTAASSECSSTFKEAVRSVAKKCVCFPKNPVTHIWTK